MKKFLIIISSIIVIAIIFLYWAVKQQEPYNALGAAQYEIEKTKFPFPCPNTNNGIWWVGGYVNPNSKIVYYDYVIKYDKNTNQTVLNNLKNNPSIFYASICNMKGPRQIIDATNGIVANYRTEDSPDILSLHATKEICRKY